MNRTVSFHSPPYLFLRSFFRVFNPSHWEPHPLVFHPRAPTIALKHQCRYPLSYETSLLYEESLQWVALPYAFHFVHNPSWKNLLPLLIHHKLWKGDPSIVQAHEDPSLLQLRYDLPIPLTHTTLVSPPSYEMEVKDDRRVLVLWMRTE